MILQCRLQSSIHPDILHIALGQLLIVSVLGLPHGEPAVEHVDFLALALIRSEQPLPFPGISQRGAGAAQLAQSAVEDDFVLVFERSDQFRRLDVEFAAGDPDGGFDVAADVI